MKLEDEEAELNFLKMQYLIISLFFQYPECKSLPAGQGTRIPCLIERMDNISDIPCHKFLSKMANIVFGDYQLVWHFHENCAKDIETYQCGRLDDGDSNVSYTITKFTMIPEIGNH